MTTRPYRRLSPLTPLVRSFLLVVAVLGTSWDDLLRGDLGPLSGLLLALLVIGGVLGGLSWWRTKYWIEGDELRVDTGVVSRQSRRIRVDRLQGIDVVQPLVARLFGLAELKMDVAGGGAREGSLAFLPLAEAHRLRESLLARRDAARVDHDPGSVARPGVQPAARTGAPSGAEPGVQLGDDARGRTAPGVVSERVVARLDLTTLVMSMLLSPETIGLVVTGGVLVAVLVAFGQVGGAVGVVPLVAGFALAQFRKLSAF